MITRYKLMSLPAGAAPFLLKRRHISGAIRMGLTKTAHLLPEEIRIETTPPQLKSDLSLALHRALPDSLRRWLVQDIQSCAQWLIDVARCSRLSVRLEKIDDRMCPQFHVDSVPLRLLCTYQGPGTEWTDPNTAYAINFGEPCDETLIHQVPTGSIVIYGGSRPGSGLQPLWHRSPAVMPGECRFLLCMDPVC